MKEKTKLIYTGLYVSFLIVLFVLFAVVQNHASGSMPIYIVLFVLLIIVTAFYWVVSKQKEVITISELSSAPDTVEENIQTDSFLSDPEVKEINIQDIVPARTNDMTKYTEELLQNMAKKFPIVQALMYIKNPNEDLFHCYAEYAYFSEDKPQEFRTGENLTGQAVKNKIIVSLDNIPEKYMIVASGLGNSDPKHLVLVPVKNSHDEVLGLIEYASFTPLTEIQTKALEGLSKKVAETIGKHLKSK